MHREYDLIDESLTEFSQDICSHTHTHTHTHTIMQYGALLT